MINHSKWCKCVARPHSATPHVASRQTLTLTASLVITLPTNHWAFRAVLGIGQS